MAGIRDIAAAAAVSPATVSRVFSGSAEVRQETRERVLEVARRLNYQPDRAARNLRRRAQDAPGLTYTAGLVLLAGEVFRTDPFAGELSAAVEHALRTLGFGLRAMTSHPQGDLPAEVASGEVDGVVVCGSGPVVAALAATVPTVTVDSYDPALGAYGVVPDYRQGVAKVVERLVAGGARRLALGIDAPTGEGLGFHQQVWAGCQDGLVAAGQTGVDVVAVGGGGTAAQGYAMGRRLFSGVVRPFDAVLASDGAMLGLYRAAGEAGLAIPGQISLVGIDGVRDSEFLFPPLTTVDTGIAGLAADAVRVLCAGVRDGEPRRGVAIRPVRLVERCSARLAPSG